LTQVGIAFPAPASKSLCGIALIGVVEFRRYSLASGEFSMTPVAWMWLLGSIVTGAIGVALLVRELRRPRC